MKKLIVCGDSYAAPSRSLPGTAHAEVLAKKLGWDVEILARQGCSNGGIRIQIDEVLRQRKDVEEIIEAAEKNKIRVMIFSHESDGGRELDGFGGFAALLRFKMR